MPNCPACFPVPATTLPSRRVAMLDNLSASAARDPRVQKVAGYLYSLLAERLGRRPDAAETSQWLMDAIHLLCDYTPDPPGQEVFQSVEWTLSGACSPSISPITDRPKGCGDCEDLASAFAALCLCLGIPARVRWWDQPGQALNHVSAQVAINGVWTDAETTIPGARLGESPYAALARVGPGFRTRVFGLNEAAGGLFRQSSPAGLPGDAATVRVTGLVHPGATYAAWSFMVDGGPLAPVWSGSSPGVNPDVASFVVPSGRHTITVFHPAPATHPPKTWVVDVPDAGLTIPYATPSTPGSATPRAVALRLTGLVQSGASQASWSFVVDGRPAAPAWYGSAPGVNPDSAAFIVAPGRHTVSATVAPGGTRTWVVDVPDAGLTVPYSSAPSGGPSRIRVAGMPARARIYLDGADVPVVARQEAGQWVVDVMPGDRSMRIVDDSGAARSWSGTVPPNASVWVDYAGMRAAFTPVQFTVTPGANPPPTPPATPRKTTVAPTPPAAPRKTTAAPTPGGTFIDFVGGAQGKPTAQPGAPSIDFVGASQQDEAPTKNSAVATGRVVVRGAPVGIFPARVVIPGGTPGDTTQSQPLTLQPGGYLAVTWPIGLARLHLGGHDIGVTVMRDTDSVYDYAADALTFRPLVTDARVAPNPETDEGPGVFPGNAKPTPPTPTTVTVELVAIYGEPDREVVLIDASGTRHAFTPEHTGSWDPGPVAGNDSSARAAPHDVWRGNVEPGRYTVRAVSANGAIREAALQVAAPASGDIAQVMMDRMQWSVAGQGTVVVRGLPANDETTLERILRGYSAYFVEAAGGGRTSQFRPLEDGAVAAYLAPGTYTLTVYHDTAAGREVPTRTAVRVAEVQVREGSVTEVRYDSMSPVRASPNDSRPRCGPDDGPLDIVEIQPQYGRVVVGGVPSGWTVMLDGSHPTEESGARVVFDRAPPGDRTLMLRHGLLRRSIDLPIVVPMGRELSLNLAYETERAEAFATHRDGVTGMTDDGRRIGYFSDLTAAANAGEHPFLSRDEERRTVREFDRVGKVDANGMAPYALFIAGHGMVAMPATQEQIDDLRARWAQLRYPRADGYYFYELSL